MRCASPPERVEEA